MEVKEVLWSARAVADALAESLPGWKIIRGPDGSTIFDKVGSFDGNNLRIYFENEKDSQVMTIGISGAYLSETCMELAEL